MPSEWPDEQSEEAMPEELLRRMHKSIKKVGEDTEQLKFNTAISEMMVFVNELQKSGCKNRSAIETLLVLLSPYAPHITEELWESIGHNYSISQAPFPSFDPKLVEESILTIAVQINGKLRGTFLAPAKSPKELLLQEAKKTESVFKFLDGQTILREIVVVDKLVNFVVKKE
jgi:leucyl-tRNA synthetase